MSPPIPLSKHHDAHDIPVGWASMVIRDQSQGQWHVYISCSRSLPDDWRRDWRLMIRAELFEPGLQIMRPEFFTSCRPSNGLIMIFGAVMPAFVGLAKLDDSAADRGIRHGVCPDETI